ncbi:carboxymuconolactone decarboxylase family protein [Paenibacillus soyae]|uniref:Carboxymuconolactone decarboxylase family protein n=1 Tax=Paenibacillus soyae TaxID=2969249 RepID=A0A9X2MQY3_9BACL|nr:carboxymuconolactone decarboxylase family protein [Paenibacillus soyae]MCR2804554.1 carboxymuconolactone decarboxylase family protein [Paenibacillus soyae]
MDSNAYAKGMEMLGKMVDPEIVEQTVNKVAKFSPDFAKLIVEFPYGSIYSRPGLDMKQRSLVTLSSLITQGAAGQLDFHVNVALNSGLTPNEIIEAIMNTLPYAGFPKAISALFVVMKVFEDRNITV